MKNWKSNTAFFVFVLAYPFTILYKFNSEIVSTSGTIALVAMTLMMFRSKITTDIISKLVDNIKIGG